ncbi:MAG: hypothetical protein KGI54_18185 [Pseudomonadota bacterium]|nr:hypothetical protein [Pseudomonadota bacterium]
MEINMNFLREAFEREFSQSPFDLPMARWPNDDKVSWPGTYQNYPTQLAWDAYQAGVQVAIRHLTEQNEQRDSHE